MENTFQSLQRQTYMKIILIHESKTIIHSVCLGNPIQRFQMIYDTICQELLYEQNLNVRYNCTCHMQNTNR